MTKIICKGSLKRVLEKNTAQGYSKTHLKSLFGIENLPIVKGTSDSFTEMVIDHTVGTSISGVQRKMFMTIKGGFLVPSNQGEYIVKPTPKQFPILSENEHVIMKLAEKIGFMVAKCSVVPFEDGELVYVTKRFDLTDKPGIKLFIEDGASICNVHPKNKGSDGLSYEHCIAAMVKACGGGIGLAALAVKMVMFSYIVGNNDLHLKNFSLKRDLSAKSNMMNAFTPLYDMLSVAPYEDYDTEFLSLSLLHSETKGEFSSSYEAYGYYTKHDFILLLESLGVNQQIGNNIVGKFISVMRKSAPTLINNSNLNEKMKAIIAKRITDRCMAIERAPIL